eukprot:TRINITY_DN1619_c0_g1_i9.p1 TRINITY_DN1619_c0_g1~~TRINITY_DN1619_c0_g1_i9.p1  ORF type:complete len:881 (+),score=169.87 TRINITY_DN1619_c0_g1_i9:70-2712(+)
MADGAGSRTKGEVMGRLKAIFDKADADHSGHVDVRELATVLAKLEVPLDTNNKKLLLKRYDRDQNGRLERDEFCEMMYFVMETKKLFDETDKDKSKSIDMKELGAVLPSLHLRMSKDTMDKLVRMFDEDKSGTIDYQEFFALVAYFKELQYQYDTYKSVGGGDFSWLEQLLNESSEAKLKAHGAKIDSLPKPITFDAFAHIVMELAIAARKRGVLGFFGLRKGPKISVLEFKPRTRAPVVHSHAGANRVARQITEQIRKEDPKPVKPPAPSPAAPGPSTSSSSSSSSSAPAFAKGKGVLFEDKAFPVATAVCNPKARTSIAAWKRPHEINPNARLFVDGVDEADVMQGSLGDCWFLSALAVIATSVGNEFVENLFVASNPKEGRYKIRFYKNGEWKIVEIDDRIPVDSSNRLVYASCKDPTEFWVPLVEKAYAKLHGSFDAIESGTISEGLKDLTGEAVEELHIDRADPSSYSVALFDKLEGFIKESFLLGCTMQKEGTKAETEAPTGLLYNHAYSVIDVQNVKGHRLLRIRNPWGQGEWRGAWSDESKEWTPAIMKHFKYEFENDGTFFMEFGDFVKNFNHITILRLLTDDKGEKWHKHVIKSEWTPDTAGGCGNHPSWSTNPQYAITAASSLSRVFVALSQPDKRFKAASGGGASSDRKYEALGITVYEAKDVRYKKEDSEDKICVSGFLSSRDVSFEFIVPAGKTYLIVPSTFQPKITSPFELLLYSQKSIKIHEIKTSVPWKEVSGRWSGVSAGGCMNHPGTCFNNPQYLLTLDKPTSLKIKLTQETSPKQKMESIGVYIFKAASRDKRVDRGVAPPVYSPPAFLGAASFHGEVQLADSATPYVVMPCTFTAGVERAFTLSLVSTTGASVSVHPLK